MAALTSGRHAGDDHDNRVTPLSGTQLILPTSTGYAYPPVVAGTASMLRPVNVGLTPRKSAFAYLVFSDGAECGASHSADLRVGLGRQSATVVRKINVEVCQGNGIYLSPFTTHRA